MSTLRMVERKFQPGRSWYSLVDVVSDRVVCGGLRSETEAEQWATGMGHTLANPPARKSPAKEVVRNALSTAAEAVTKSGFVAPDPSSGTRRPDRLRGGGVQSATATPSRGRPLVRCPDKSTFACCAATKDEYERYCIGDCGPDCLRRAARRLAARRAS